MNTFLPITSDQHTFFHQAVHIDTVRLNKQIVEVKQMLVGIAGGAHLVVNGRQVLYSDGGYPTHVCTRMWADHIDWLARYGLDCIRVYRDRTDRGRVHSKIEVMFAEVARAVQTPFPTWLGDDRLHSSHRRRLLGKDPDWYGRFGWDEQPSNDDSDYWWPVERLTEARA